MNAVMTIALTLSTGQPDDLHLGRLFVMQLLGRLAGLPRLRFRVDASVPATEPQTPAADDEEQRAEVACERDAHVDLRGEVGTTRSSAPKSRAGRTPRPRIAILGRVAAVGTHAARHVSALAGWILGTRPAA